MNMIIREANPDESCLLTSIIKASFTDVTERFGLTVENSPLNPAFTTEDDQIKGIEKGIRYFIAEDGDGPAGCAGLDPKGPDDYWLARLAVLPEKRNRGYGAALVRHVMAQARDIGLKKLTIGAISLNKELIAWYEKLGFTHKETRKLNGPPFDVVIMEIALIAQDFQSISLKSYGQSWDATWYPPEVKPEGKNHGVAGICLTENNEIVLISTDNTRWDIPAGRPEKGETPEQTLEREMAEEACINVKTCRLLGYCSSLCTKGHEKGLVLVRSFWHVTALVGPWEPEHEIHFRKIVPLSELDLHLPDTFKPFIFRALRECSV